MSTATAPALTVDDLEAMPDGDNYELVNGELVERTMSPLSGFVAGEIYARLRDHCRTASTAWAFPDGIGFTLRAGELDQLRKPDAAVVRKDRQSDGRLPTRAFPFAPDIAVEVLSPSDVYSEVDAKIHDYLEAGTHLVWLAIPARRRIIAYRPDGTETSHGPAEIITADPVLPGFRLTVGDVFPND